MGFKAGSVFVLEVGKQSVRMNDSGFRSLPTHPLFFVGMR